MSRHPKAELYRKHREAGETYAQIAKRYGVSSQAVAAACARGQSGRFRAWTKEQCIYPNLRQWLNENQIGMTGLLCRLDILPTDSARGRYESYLKGRTYPQKKNIDRMLQVTGMTYEQLWMEDEK